MIDPKEFATQIATKLIPAAKNTTETSLRTMLADSTSPSARAAFGIMPKTETKTELPIRNIGSENDRPWRISVPRTLPEIPSLPGGAEDSGKLHKIPPAKPGDNKPVNFPNRPQRIEIDDILKDWYGEESRGAAKPTIKSLVDWRDKLYNIPDNEKQDPLTRAIIEDWYDDDMRTPNTKWPKDASELNELTQLIQRQPRDSANSVMLKQLSKKSSSEYMDEALAASLGVWGGYEYYDHYAEDDKANEKNTELGILSSKYESNGKAGAIGNTSGDPGGKSYGAWQISYNAGSLGEFMTWLSKEDEKSFSALDSALKKDGGKPKGNFDTAWTKLAESNEEQFFALQHEYIKTAYYDKAAEKLLLTADFDISAHSSALQNVLWSAAVQHGPGNAASIFKAINMKASDAEIISQVYKERLKYIQKLNEDLKKSVTNRFINEEQDALKMLQEGGW